MESEYFLVMVETSGNQSYIFSTNKLREVVGASEMIYRVGTTYVEEAIKKIFKREFNFSKLFDEPAVTDDKSNGVEVLLATSGKALLLVKGKEKAKAFISEWSRIVLMKAPGVDATGIFSGPVDLAATSLTDKYDTDHPLPKEGGSIAWAVTDVHKRFERARSHRIAPQSRFPRLPVVDSCQHSEYPAMKLTRDAKEEPTYPISKVCIKKEKAQDSDEFAARMFNLYKNTSFKGVTTIQEIESYLEKKSRWLAVVHADGNGLGKIFLKFGDHVAALIEKSYFDKGEDVNRTYIKAYREFSLNLDKITKEAFQISIQRSLDLYRSNGRDIAPVLPLIVGGDDLTVVIDGLSALKFTEAYLKEFKRRTSQDTLITAIAGAALDGHEFLGISAGVSITKPHFPFSTSYKLAENLIKSAKTVKNHVGMWGVSLDFNILYDSSASSIKAIRDKLLINEMQLSAGPFVLYDEEAPAPNLNGWIELHSWTLFKDAVRALRKRDKDDENKYALPPTQAHHLRDLMHRSKKETIDAQWKLLLERYNDFANVWNKNGKRELFIKLNGKDKEKYLTRFHDALIAKDFLRKEEQDEDQ